MARVVLERVACSYAGRAVVVALDLVVGHGELVALVGPSGAGKTTVLRLIAGLQPVDAGSIRIGDQDVTHVPTRFRDVAMVFQEGMLNPRLDVRRNIAFPLRLRRLPRTEVDRRVTAEARAMGIERLLARMPHELSEGHRRAASTAREMVRVPSVFLLDEPLARVDPHQRRRMRHQIALLQRGYGATMLYATNDQQEALALGDRVAVLDRGALQQVGPPEDVTRRPANLFVAGFLGAPPTNLLPARVTIGGQGAVLEFGGGLRVAAPGRAGLAGRELVAGIRPADLRPQPEPAPGIAVRLTVEEVEYLGAEAVVRGRAEGLTERCAEGLTERRAEGLTERRAGEVALTAGRAEGRAEGRAGEVALTATAPVPPPRAGSQLLRYLAASRIDLYDAATGRALAHGL